MKKICIHLSPPSSSSIPIFFFPPIHPIALSFERRFMNCDKLKSPSKVARKPVFPKKFISPALCSASSHFKLNFKGLLSSGRS